MITMRTFGIVDPSGYPAGLIMSQRKVNYPVAKGFRLWGCIAFFLLMIGILVLITPPDKDLDEEDFGIDLPEYSIDKTQIMLGFRLRPPDRV